MLVEVWDVKNFMGKVEREEFESDLEDFELYRKLGGFRKDIEVG